VTYPADAFGSLDVCTVSDALDAFGYVGAVAGIRPVWEGARMAGRVITMRVVPAAGLRAEHHLGAAAIDMAQPGDIIVIEQDGAKSEIPPSATWGGLLSRAAHQRSIGGVVIDGACRDVDEIRELGLPVSSRWVVPFTARRRFIEQSVGEPIYLDGVTVNTGDYVIADGTGVAFITKSQLDQVLSRARDIAAREARMAGDLGQGVSVSQVMGRNYEEILDHG
jgi:regulator of RNase E activity RraA